MSAKLSPNGQRVLDRWLNANHTGAWLNGNENNEFMRKYPVSAEEMEIIINELQIDRTRDRTRLALQEQGTVLLQEGWLVDRQPHHPTSWSIKASGSVDDFLRPRADDAPLRFNNKEDIDENP